MKEVTSQELWDQQPALRSNGLFLQSWNNKALCEELGQKTWLFEDEASGLSALVTKIEAKRGHFFFLPYGPLSMEEPNSEQVQQFFASLYKKARTEKVHFIRVSPFWKETSSLHSSFRKAGFKKAPMHMLAETLWLLPLADKSEEELMMGMEKKHRNLVKRAEKDGVEIKMTTEEASIDRFWELYEETFKRHKFTPYPKKMLRAQLELFAQKDDAIMVEAWYQGTLLCSAMIMMFGDIAAYHHGASSSDPAFRKIPAAYALQWAAIMEAKRRGKKAYNFWGVAPHTMDEKGKREYDQKNHPFNGITHFKCGFGGERKDLLPCMDLKVSSKYYLTRGFETLRKWKRGF